MSEVSSQREQRLPLSAARQVDEACNAFELAWQAGQRPRIEDVLGDRPEPERTALLHELIALELEYRRRAGEQPVPDEYRARFPDLAGSLGPTFIDAGMPSALSGPSGLPSVPGYQVLRELGRGGMAVVWWAWQPRLSRPVALKMILAGAHAGPQELARFQTEAEAVARLQHPGVVQIHDVGRHEGLPYLALEYVDGPSLARELSGTPLPWRRAAQLAETLARTVHHVHRQGIVHRDLTPANVLLTRDGQPKVTDFGLAKLLIGSGPTLTHTGAFLGTPSYAAPEQAAGKVKEIGPATDVYALGAILYEMLTGRPPFKAETPLETLAQVQSQEPVSPSRLQPRVPRDLTTICLKCLHKEPRKRYASGQDLAEDLRRFLAGEPIRARPVGRTERLWRWCRRNPVVATLAAAVVLLLAALAGGAWLKNVQLSSALGVSEEANRRANAKLWESLRDQARALRMSRRPGQRVQSLQAIRDALQLPLPPGHSLDELRTEAVAALALPDLQLLREWEGCPAGHVVAFDGRLERYARLGLDGTVTVRRTEDDVPTHRWHEATEGPWPFSESNLRFSPDGRFLSVLHRRSACLTVRRLDGPDVALAHQGTRVAEDWPLDFSPDGSRLAYALTDGRLTVVDLASGRATRLPHAAATPAYLRFAPDGRRLAIGVNREGAWAVEVWDAVSGQVLCKLPHPRKATHLAWHPDGRTLATCCDDRLLRLWDVPSGQLLSELRGHRLHGLNCVFNRTGDWLLSNDWHGVLRVWEPSSGRQMLSVPAAGYALLHASPDDRVPAVHVADNTRLLLLQLHAGLGYRTIAPRSGISLRSIADDDPKVHPRGRLLAASIDTNSLVLVDLAAGRAVCTLQLPGAGRPLLWTPAGDLLTCGSSGLWHWPAHPDPADGRGYHFGPPRRLLPGTDSGWGASADGQTVAIPRFNRGAVVVRLDRPDHEVPLRPQQDVRHCAVSPDGAWVATGSHDNREGLGAKVWETATGRLVRALPVPGYCGVRFSPDGRWLLTTGGGCRLWEVGTWKERLAAGGANGCLSADGSLLAVEDATGAIRLLRTEGGAELARLEAPEQTRLVPRCFTPDGTRLVAVGIDTQALHVWDFRALRPPLAELGLDWDLPAYPSPDPGQVPSPLRATVEDGQGK
jgi:WD40 repeat protein